MKRLIILIFAGLMISVISLAQEKVTETENDITVYITKSGAKYHKSTCNYLKGGGIPKKLSEVKGTHTPCSVCKPNELNAESQEKKANYEGKTTSTGEKTSSGRIIHTGPRGGKYYINKNGKKTYVKKKK